MALEFFKSTTHFDFIGKRNYLIPLTALVVLYGIFATFLQGLHYGIDFEGGTLVQLQMAEAPRVEEIRSALDTEKLGESIIQTLGENKVAVRVRSVAGQEEAVADRIAGALAARYGKDKVSVQGVSVVGPQVSADMQRMGLMAVVYGLLGILLYITIRFRFIFSVGAVVATLHDVMFVVAIFALAGKEITLTVIAAILTIIGYSVNDTVVVFDRIRENVKKSPKDPIGEIINHSINQTLSRTILTALTVFMVSLCLFFLGGEVLHDFAFAMIIGTVVGCYSSIFIASPFLLINRKLTGLAESAKR
jgi:preprotein translocase subunit SecF